MATENTPPETREEKIITNVHSILYWVDKNNILGPPPENPASDPQFSRWETAVQNWWAQNSGSFARVTAGEKPTLTDDVHRGELGPKISILEPNENISYRAGQRINLKISNPGSFPIQKIDVFVNDVYLGSAEGPLAFSFIPEELDNLKEKNTIRVISYDSVFNRSEGVSTFKVEQ